MAENCPEKVDWDFLWWILYSGRIKERRFAYEKTAENYIREKPLSYAIKKN